MRKLTWICVAVGLAYSFSTTQAAVVITTPQQLQDIVNDLTGDYVLGADIDLTDFPWAGIGNSDQDYFTGTFDGDFHIINGLTAIDDVGVNPYKNTSLFGIVGLGGVIKNVGMTNVDVRGGWYSAALVADLRGELSQCFVEGGTVTLAEVGGNGGTLIGLVRDTGVVSDSYSTAELVIEPGEFSQYKGGFSGGIGGTATNLYYAGEITGDGVMTGSAIPFTGYVTDSEIVTGAYYDKELVDIDDENLGRTTAEMMTQDTFVDWDFENIWTMVEGQTYPTLSGFAKTLAWDGGEGNFGSAHWNTLQMPSADMEMTIDADSGDSVVTVADDFITDGTGPASSIAIGENNDASLVVNDTITLESIGEVTVGEFGTLTVDGTLTAAMVASAGTLSGSGTIVADIVEVAGALSPGGSGSIGTLAIDGELELFYGTEEGEPKAVYQAEIDATGADLLTLADVTYLAGTLSVDVIGRLDDSGESTHKIVEAIGRNDDIEEFIEDKFEFPPEADDHLGYGVFFEGIEYVGDVDEVTSVEVDVFQAEFGDIDGNRTVNIMDIFKIKSSDKGFGTGATDAEWIDGDMVGATLNDPADGIVNIMDIFAIKNAGYFGAGSYAAGDETTYNAVPEPGTLVMLAMGLAFGAIAWRRGRHHAA